MNIRILLFFYLITTCLCFSQNPQEVDSLQHLIQKERKPGKKIDHIRRLGDLYVIKGDYKTGMKHYLRGLRIAEKYKLKSYISDLYNNISVIYSETSRYPQAIEYAHKALRLCDEMHDDVNRVTTLNTVANAYYMDLQDSLALYYFNESLKCAKKIKDTLGIATGYRNLAAAFHELGQNEKAITCAHQALAYHLKLGDKQKIFSNLYALAEIYLATKQLDSSLVYYNKSYAYLKAHPIESYHALSNFYEGYSYIFAETGDYENAFEYYKIYNKYKDSIYNKESSEQITELQTKYDTEKKEERIRNQKKLLNKEQKVRIYLYIALALVVLFFIVLYFWIRSRQKQQLQQALFAEKQQNLQKIIETEEKERSRIAKDLHDGIVQELTAIKLHLNGLENLEGEALRAKTRAIAEELGNSTKEVREISYRMMPVSLRELGLLPALHDMLEKALISRGITFELEQYGIEERFSEKIEVSLFRICQELVNNVIKHSQANSVSIMLKLSDGQLTLVFEDNGKGFDAEKTDKGIGLNSLNSRIEMVNGEIHYESGAKSGTTAIIRIPIE